VKAVLHDDYTRVFLPARVAHEPADFQRALDGFGPRVAEKYPVHAGNFGQSVGQLLLPGDAHQVATVQQ
jgi:hypothetical protein